MNKKLILPGCILWIAGLAASIIGMNIDSKAGQLTAVIGNILFFIGREPLPDRLRGAEK